MRLARVVNSLDADALGLFSHANQEGCDILRAAGARTAWNGVMAMTHAFGGTVMGHDPTTSVCDTYGRSHDIPNLLVSGGSLFPTAGGGSPTFTIYALAERATHHVLGHWSDYAAPAAAGRVRTHA